MTVIDAPDLFVRSGIEADHPAVAEVYAASYTATFTGWLDFTPELLPFNMLFNLSQPHLLFVAETGDGIVGFALCSDDLTEVRQLYVLPSAQGIGVGTALLDRYLLTAATLLPSDILLTLNVNERNTAAVKFYERFGYRDSGERAVSLLEDDEQLVLVRPVMLPRIS